MVLALVDDLSSALGAAVEELLQVLGVDILVGERVDVLDEFVSDILSVGGTEEHVNPVPLILQVVDLAHKPIPNNPPLDPYDLIGLGIDHWAEFHEVRLDCIQLLHIMRILPGNEVLRNRLHLVPYLLEECA